MGEPLKEKQQQSKTTDGAQEKKGSDEAAQKKGAKVEVELSEEDLALKTNLELLVQRVSDSKHGVAKLALEQMRTEIKTSTRYALRSRSFVFRFSFVRSRDRRTNRTSTALLPSFSCLAIDYSIADGF